MVLVVQANRQFQMDYAQSATRIGCSAVETFNGKEGNKGTGGRSRYIDTRSGLRSCLLGPDEIRGRRGQLPGNERNHTVDVGWCCGEDAPLDIISGIAYPTANDAMPCELVGVECRAPCAPSLFKQFAMYS